jgi:hypothetical protein
MVRYRDLSVWAWAVVYGAFVAIGVAILNVVVGARPGEGLEPFAAGMLVAAGYVLGWSERYAEAPDA